MPQPLADDPAIPPENEVRRAFHADLRPASVVGSGFPGTVDVIPEDRIPDLARQQALVAQALELVRSLPAKLQKQLNAIYAG